MFYKKYDAVITPAKLELRSGLCMLFIEFYIAMDALVILMS